MSLDSKRAFAAARTAAAAAGVDPQTLSLVRAGSAAVYGCGEVIIRVTGPQVPAREVAAHLESAKFLNENGISAAVPALPAHVDAGDCRATVWRREHILPEPVPAAWVGETAAKMHALAAPAWMTALDPLAVTRPRVRTIKADQSVPLEVRTALAQALMNSESRVSRVLDSGIRAVVHGDIPGNVLVTPRGCVLIDFENTGAGDPVFEIARLTHRVLRYRDGNAALLKDTLAAYRAAGGDVDMAAVRELMPVLDLINAAWAVVARRVSAEMAAEAQVRMGWVTDPSNATPCTPL